MAHPRPSLFIGSSSEAFRIAEAVKAGLSGVADVILWTDGDTYKELNELFLDGLVAAAANHDFAVMIFAADDTVISRKQTRKMTRDNVIFELGLFWSRLGRKRTFVIKPSGKDFKILSDLDGLTLAEYMLPDDAAEMAAAVAPACAKIAALVAERGQRSASSAPQSVSDVAEPLGQLIHAARQKGLPVVVKNIGLDMESTWPMLKDKILDVGRVESVTWHSLMVDPDSPQFDGLWSSTVSPDVARNAAANMREHCAPRTAALAKRAIEFACRSYGTLPSVHGFLFNGSTAFLSLCGLTDGKLMGAPNPYLRVDKPRGGGPDDPASAHLISAFESWFDHHWAHGARRIWPLPEVEA